MAKSKLGLEIDHTLAERAEEVLGWQKEHRNELNMDALGFSGDEDCVALGLETMEEEMTMEQASILHYKAKAGIIERDRRMVIPIASATPQEARDARCNDDVGDRPEYYDGDD